MGRGVTTATQVEPEAPPAAAPAEAIMAETAPAEKPAVTEKPAKPAKAAKAEKKAVKIPKEKTPKASKTASSHPPYLEMIKEAIATLKEKTGSSTIAIAKFLEDKHKGLPGNWKKILNTQLKKLTSEGRLVKVKASYKLGDELKKATKPKSTKTAAAKKAISPAKPKLVKANTEAPKASEKTTPSPKKIAAKPAAKPKKAAAVKKPVKAATKKSTKKTTAPKPKKLPSKPAVKKSTATTATTRRPAAKRARSMKS